MGDWRLKKNIHNIAKNSAPFLGGIFMKFYEYVSQDFFRGKNS